MADTIHDLTTKIRQITKSMTTTYKDEVEGFFNSKISVHNIMYNFFNSNISEFAVNLQGTLHEVKYKTFIQNMHKLGWKTN